MNVITTIATPEQATRLAVQSGSWRTPSTWEGGIVPKAGRSSSRRASPTSLNLASRSAVPGARRPALIVLGLIVLNARGKDRDS